MLRVLTCIKAYKKKIYYCFHVVIIGYHMKKKEQKGFRVFQNASPLCVSSKYNKNIL
jgi:hypothetical protein